MNYPVESLQPCKVGENRPAGSGWQKRANRGHQKNVAAMQRGGLCKRRLQTAHDGTLLTGFMLKSKIPVCKDEEVFEQGVTGAEPAQFKAAAFASDINDRRVNIVLSSDGLRFRHTRMMLPFSE
jgi:hypothetical protein